MEMNINEDVLRDTDLELSDFLVLLTLKDDYDIVSVMKKLNQEALILYNQSKKAFFVSDKGLKLINSVLEVKQKEEQSCNDLRELATTLKSLFPKGIKQGTNTPWTEAVPLIMKRLEAFFKKFGEQPYDKIVEATKKYIDSFNGDYRMMRVLSYFIMKTIINNDGEKEMKSDLLTTIENLDDYEEQRSEDWTSGTV